MDVTLIVPTRNERGNIVPLLERTAATLEPLQLSWEVLFADDSDDDTPGEIEQARQQGGPVRLLHRRRGERHAGLSGAVVAAFRDSGAELVAVMDGDLQHPPERLSELLAPLLADDADIALGTRYVSGGSASEGLAGLWRKAVSRGGRSAVHLLFAETRPASDPLGGFFALRRAVIDDVELRPWGYKILLEVLVRGRWSRLVEVPYSFSPRLEGVSKAKLREGLRFARHVARLWWSKQR